MNIERGVVLLQRFFKVSRSRQRFGIVGVDNRRSRIERDGYAAKIDALVSASVINKKFTVPLV